MGRAGVGLREVERYKRGRLGEKDRQRSSGGHCMDTVG